MQKIHTYTHSHLVETYCTLKCLLNEQDEQSLAFRQFTVQRLCLGQKIKNMFSHVYLFSHLPLELSNMYVYMYI